MKIGITPGRLSGETFAPPSKSYAHRMMICAALANGDSTVVGISDSEDMKATMDCIKALGVNISLENKVLKVSGGINTDGRTTLCFPCRESGSTLRFFIPIALTTGCNVEFTGTQRLMERGVGVYEELLGSKGCKFEHDAERLFIRGGLTPGEYTLPGNISSQYISGLLFALPLLGGDSVVNVIPPVESRPYIDITVSVLKSFGVNIDEIKPNVFYIGKGEKYTPRDISVEGDWSNAAALLAFNHIGGNVRVKGLLQNSLQGDRVAVEHLRALGGENARVDISSCPDLGPVLFATAAALNGAVFTGTKRLAIKESDRAKAMAEELMAFGIKVNVYDNSVEIKKGSLQKPARVLSSHNDHRIVMALTLLLTLTGGEIDGVEAINKSFPDYFEILGSLGLEAKYEA